METWHCVHQNKGLILSVLLYVQMSMSVNDQASVGPASATTPSGTTHVYALWTTCRSMEGTTAWVGLHTLVCISQQSGSHAFNLLSLSSENTQTWGRATASGTFTPTTGLVMESWPSTWPRRCAAAPTMLERPGTNRASPVQLLLPVSVTRYPETHSGKTLKTFPSLRISCSCLFQLSTSYCVVTRLLASLSTSTLASP